jgi:hypothetical protein
VPAASSSANRSDKIPEPETRWTKSKIIILGGCVVWLLVLGYIDRLTGYELGLFAFYTAPIGIAAWNLGRGPGIVTASIASTIWFLADRLAGDRYSSPYIAYWNTGMHLTTFLINAIAISKIKSSLDQRHRLERELLETKQKLAQLTATRQRSSPAESPVARSG